MNARRNRGLAENDEFVTGMPRGIQASVGDVRQSVAAIERRLANLERRRTASKDFKQLVLARPASIHESIDNLRGDPLGMDRRVRAIEARWRAPTRL